MSILIGLGLLGGIAAAFGTLSATPKAQASPKPAVSGSTLVVGGGCFWCIEPLFEMVKGVKDVESGYAGGRIPNPSYEQVCGGTTGHAEVIKITYDPKKISEHDLLTLFFTMHDPTTKDRQGPDSGPQYRSVIFYETPEQRAMAEKVIGEITKEKVWPNKIVTTLEPLLNYTTAEDEHQDYYKNYETANPIKRAGMNAGYCRVVIEPKVRKFRDKYKHLLKD